MINILGTTEIGDSFRFVTIVHGGVMGWWVWDSSLATILVAIDPWDEIQFHTETFF